MTNTIKVRIIMPSVTLFETDAVLVNIPGTEGVFGVLPGHMQMVATMKPDVVNIFETLETEQRFFVYGGVAQITDTQINIITEFAVSLEDQKKSQILQKIEEFKSDLSLKEIGGMDYRILQDDIDKHQSLLKFIN